MYDSLVVETQEPAVVRRYASILILLLIATLPNHAQSICDTYQSNDVASIFLGYVSDVITEAQPTCVSSCTEKVRVKTLEVFKGNPGSEIIITNSQFRIMKDLLMAKGHEYLIWTRAPRDNGDVYGDGTEIAKVTPETLAWLRAYPTAPQTVRIFGNFIGATSTLDASGILVTLTENSNQNRTLTTVPNNKNTYSFNDLPPGIYTVSATVPSGMVAVTGQGGLFDIQAHNPTSPLPLPPTPTGAIPKINESIFSVAPKGCAMIGFVIMYDSHIKGRVTDTSGQPVAGARVGLILRGGGREDELARGRLAFLTQQETDADGIYDFSRLDPGSYSVVFHPSSPGENDPYPPVFYPAKSMPSDAAILHLDASGAIDNIDFIRPDALSPATVHILFVHKDGSPIKSNNIQFVDPANSNGYSTTAETDATGHADAHLFAGREYTLTAATQEEQPSCAGPVEFIAKDGLTLAPLIPDKNVQACRPPVPTPAFNSASAQPAAAHATPANSSSSTETGVGTTPTDDGQIKSVGGGVSTPVAIKRVEPKFSDEAQRQGPLNAIVIVGLVVDQQGEFWAYYSPPYVSTDDQAVLRKAGIDFPQGELTSAHITFVKKH
jgi:hypothetical protein